MSALRVLRPVAVIVLAVVLSTCRDSAGTDKPSPGWLAVNLTTPNSDDGGILFTVAGPAVDSVRTSHAHVLNRPESASSRRIVIAGTLSAGMIAEIRVPDTRQAAQYSATIQQVASRTDYQQRPLTGYALSLSAPPR